MRIAQRGRAIVGALLILLVVCPTPSARAQTQVPPPTPVPVPGGGMSPSPFPSTLRTPAPAGRQPPAVRAASALLMDLDTGQVLFALNATDKRPIASLT